LNKETKKQTILGYLFLIPSLAVFAVFMFYPLLYTFYLSFFEWNMVKPVKKFVGLNNYIAVFRDPNTFKILGNTLAYILVLLVLNFVLPYILSFILSAVIRHGKSFYKAVFFLPSVISLVVGSILYTWILNPISGPVAIILGKFGIQMPFWSKTDGWVIAVLCIITTWKTFGYNFINILAGVSGVSQEVIGSGSPVEDFSGHHRAHELRYRNLRVHYHHCPGTPVCVHSHQGHYPGRTELRQLQPDLRFLPRGLYLVSDRHLIGHFHSDHAAVHCPFTSGI